MLADGVEALTTRAIATEAGVPVASLYQYFGDKEAVLLALAGRDMEEMDAQVATDLAALPSFWEMRTVLNEQQRQMKAYAGAPLWLKEVLIFPYLAGADFVRWYLQGHPGAMPFAGAMPVSTEQILHPERYAGGDAPALPREPRP